MAAQAAARTMHPCTTPVKSPRSCRACSHLRAAAPGQQPTSSKTDAASEVQPAQRAPPRPAYIEDTATANFLDWARASGVSFPKLRPATFGGVRGLAASAAVGVDDVLLSVPRAAALTLPPKQRCPCPEFVSPEHWDASPWFVKLALRLLAEQRKGSASRLAPWLAQLPRNVPSPVTWPPNCLRLLGCPHLESRIEQQRAEWDTMYDALTARGMAAGVQPPSKQEFVRALCLVRSRTFSGPYVASTLPERGRLAALVAVLVAANSAAGGDLARGLGAAAAVFLFNVIYELVLSNKLRQYAMCPAIDLANHSSVNTTEVSYDYPRDAFLVTSAATYAPEEQVFISYGAQGNDSLLQLYAFVERDNPYDAHTTRAALTWLAQLTPASPERLDALGRVGLRSALEEVSIGRAGFGAATLQALRYVLAPAAAGGAASGLPAGAPSAYAEPADGETEQRVALALVHICQQELAVLQEAGTAATAAAASGSSGSGSNSRRSGSSSGRGAPGGALTDAATAAGLAADFREARRKLLQACLDNLTGGTAPQQQQH